MTVPKMFAIEHSYYIILLSLQIIVERPSLLLGQNYLLILRQHDTEKKKNLETDLHWKTYHKECLSVYP